MGTFSIVARCPTTSQLGIGVATAVPRARDRVPHLEPGVGAVATQAKASIMYGVEGLRMMKRGLHPREALEVLLRRDVERESRQVVMLDRFGRKAVFTGRETLSWSGHMIAEDYAIAGNLLVGKEVIDAMADVFEASEGEALAERLLKALGAGEEAGGDVRGTSSAALLVADSERMRVDVSASDDPMPIKKLEKLLRQLQVVSSA
jgi:uncharacterized Ntn-hydrolase superfamily protein